ncbi:hypothetical protein SPC_1178 [Salmonella enterica subsp. enterica serovar Paratyphi C str. RKS4594]|uniref:Uncharacterized protein n=1 Tax=Salmonella paratyphi C (strain RKS4594) TaxID=476213 RepID=C0PYS7_SALPC|nr:hypothetical protein SPC_1178 [Salmonella enterica subsp. enterica serovar Paratyphi C str. RKS4594]
MNVNNDSKTFQMWLVYTSWNKSYFVHMQLFVFLSQFDKVVEKVLMLLNIAVSHIKFTATAP